MISFCHFGGGVSKNIISVGGWLLWVCWGGFWTGVCVCGGGGVRILPLCGGGGIWNFKGPPMYALNIFCTTILI